MGSYKTIRIVRLQFSDFQKNYLHNSFLPRDFCCNIYIYKNITYRNSNIFSKRDTNKIASENDCNCIQKCLKIYEYNIFSIHPLSNKCAGDQHGMCNRSFQLKSAFNQLLGIAKKKSQTKQTCRNIHLITHRFFQLIYFVS